MERDPEFQDSHRRLCECLEGPLLGASPEVLGAVAAGLLAAAVGLASPAQRPGIVRAVKRAVSVYDGG